MFNRLGSGTNRPLHEESCSSRLLCCCVPRVTMVQSAQPRKRNQPCVPGRLRLDWPLVRSVLRERIVNAILVMVRHVVANQPTEMFFVEGDDMVQDLSPAHPALGDSILPERLQTRPLRLQTGR